MSRAYGLTGKLAGKPESRKVRTEITGLGRSQVTRAYATPSKSRFEAVERSLFSHRFASLAYLIYIAFPSDLDESLELEYESNEILLPDSDYGEDESDEDLELEAS
jgi:hypothetical protein